MQAPLHGLEDFLARLLGGRGDVCERLDAQLPELPICEFPKRSDSYAHDRSCRLFCRRLHRLFQQRVVALCVYFGLGLVLGLLLLRLLLRVLLFLFDLGLGLGLPVRLRLHRLLVPLDLREVVGVLLLKGLQRFRVLFLLHLLPQRVVSLPQHTKLSHHGLSRLQGQQQRPIPPRGVFAGIRDASVQGFLEHFHGLKERLDVAKRASGECAQLVAVLAPARDLVVRFARVAIQRIVNGDAQVKPRGEHGGHVEQGNIWSRNLVLDVAQPFPHDLLPAKLLRTLPPVLVRQGVGSHLFAHHGKRKDGSCELLDGELGLPLALSRPFVRKDLQGIPRYVERRRVIELPRIVYTTGLPQIVCIRHCCLRHGCPIVPVAPFESRCKQRHCTSYKASVKRPGGQVGSCQLGLLDLFSPPQLQ